MSDLDRLAADVGRALGSEPLRSVELEDDPGRRSSQLEELRELLASAPAALASTRDADLADDGVPGGLGAAELEREAEAAGLTVGWLGVMDGHGGVGRRAGLTALLEGTRGGEARQLLLAGPLGLRFDPEASGGGGKARVLIASYEFVGPTRTGGIGTAYTSLAEALAADGHEVTVLFSGEEGHPGAVREWTRPYADLGIRLYGLPARELSPDDPAYRHQIRSRQVYRWLRDAERERPFDVIHFPEVLGHGYFAVRAKQQGLAFAETTIVLGTRSSTSWVLETNGVLMQAQGDFIDDFCEREAVAGSDVVVSPSAYMLDWVRSKGWRVPERSFVQQYVRSGAVTRLAAAAANEANPEAEAHNEGTEIVFFGRLEPRKGLRVFCDALDRLAALGGPAPGRVTFLGKESTIDGVPAAEYIGGHAESWPWPHEIDRRPEPATGRLLPDRRRDPG